MIQSILKNDQSQASADAAQNQTTSKQTLCHTPFGNVLVDEMSVPDLAALMSSKPNSESQASLAVSTSATPPAVTPNAQTLFGDHPWVDNPGGTGPNGTSWGFNPIYFATHQTAETIAKMVGGTVVEKDAILSAPGSPFVQNQPNEMIDLPNGNEIYAGLVADFYNHGYSQNFVNKLVQNEVKGS